MLGLPIIGAPFFLTYGARSMLPQRGLPVEHDGETLAAALSVYDVADGIERSIESVIHQRFDRVVLNYNGGPRADRVSAERALTRFGYEPDLEEIVDTNLTKRTYRSDTHPELITLERTEQTGKGRALNEAMTYALDGIDRVAFIDGDTVLDPTFVSSMRRSFYRLYDRGDHLELHDLMMQSGHLRSLEIERNRLGRFIDRGRDVEFALGHQVKRGQADLSTIYTMTGAAFVARLHSGIEGAEELPTERFNANTTGEDHELTNRNLGLAQRSGPLERTDGIFVRTNAERVPIDEYARDRPIELVRSGRGAMVMDAIAYSENPQTIGHLERQLLRWTKGGWDNLGAAIRGTPRQKLASGLPHLEGIVQIGLAGYLGAAALTGELSAEAAATIIAIDAGIVSSLAGKALYDLAPGTPLNKTRSAARALARGLPSYYAQRAMNAAAFVASGAKSALERIVTTRSDGSWGRRFRSGLGPIARAATLTGLLATTAITPVARDPDVRMLLTGPNLAEHYLEYETSAAAEGSAFEYAELNRYGLAFASRIVPVMDEIERAANAYAIPVEELIKLCNVESFCDPTAQGPTNDFGWGQITGDIVRDVHEHRHVLPRGIRAVDRDANVFDPAYNIEVSARRFALARDRLLEATGDVDYNEAYPLYVNHERALIDGSANPAYAEHARSYEEGSELARSVLAAYSAYESGIASEREERIFSIRDEESLAERYRLAARAGLELDAWGAESFARSIERLSETRLTVGRLLNGSIPDALAER